MSEYGSVGSGILHQEESKDVRPEWHCALAALELRPAAVECGKARTPCLSQPSRAKRSVLPDRRGALVPDRARIDIAVLEADKRPVSAAADHTEVRNIIAVSAHLDRTSAIDMLFDPDHGLEERILREQFVY